MTEMLGARTLIHVPGPPIDKVQACAACGRVLIDRRKEMRLEIDSAGDCWWSMGHNVEMFVEGGGAWAIDAPSNCHKEDE